MSSLRTWTVYKEELTEQFSFSWGKLGHTEIGRRFSKRSIMSLELLWGKHRVREMNMLLSREVFRGPVAKQEEAYVHGTLSQKENMAV